MVAHTVVSVGPYALIMRRPADQVATSSGVVASPATTRVSTVASAPAGTAASTGGGSVTWVTPCRATVAANGSPGASSSLPASTKVAPESRPMHISHTEASKLGEANWSTRLVGPTLSCSKCVASSGARPLWVTATPLGRPVEPEV